MSSQSNPTIFEINDASVRFGGDKEVYGLNLRVGEGEKVVIRGKSGSGKTTLLRLLLGFAQPSSGEVKYRGEMLTPDIVWKLRAKVAYVNQAPDGDSITAKEAMLRLCRFKACDQTPASQQLLAALEQFGLPGAALKQLTSDLSGGERQRVALAAALLLERPIYLLDEPTAALDDANKQRVADFFLTDRPDWTVVVISHDEVWRRPQSATLIDR